MAADRPKDIQRVRLEEERRGKARLGDSDKVRELQALKEDWKRILRGMKFTEAVSALGLRKGTPEYQSFVLTWREFQQQLLDEMRERKRQP